MNRQAIKQALRYGPYAWPGGYPLYFVAHDGEPLSFDAVRDNFRQVLRGYDGWRVIGVQVNWEDPELFCAHYGNRIESAYAEEGVPV